VSRRMGLGVSAHTVRAVLIKEETIAWAGVAEWSDEAALTEAIARLAAESGGAVRRAAVALERDVVQLRTILPAPRLSANAARRYASLESARLFRRKGAPLAIDALLVRGDADNCAIWAAAASETLLQSVLDGCAQAGLEVEAIGPAADVVHASTGDPTARELVFPNGGTSEVVDVTAEGAWRSRRVSGIRPVTVPWHPALAVLGPEAAHFAPAFSVALRLPRLQLLPAHSRAKRAHRVRRRLAQTFGIAVFLWTMAIAIYTVRLSVASSGASGELAANGAAIDSALALRRELETARTAIYRFRRAEIQRSRQLGLLADITRLIGDSAFLTAYRSDPEGRIHLSGYAPSAARVVANLERSAALREPRLEAPVAREVIAGRGELDRFVVVARGRVP
jgi:hypothetical protein